MSLIKKKDIRANNPRGLKKGITQARLIHRRGVPLPLGLIIDIRKTIGLGSVSYGQGTAKKARARAPGHDGDGDGHRGPMSRRFFAAY
jgi:hypothetical protein